MDIPIWFGKSEYYLLIITVWFGLSTWIIVNLIRAKFNLKSKIVEFKHWLEKRRIKKEEQR